jgi:hypothetical protein
MLLDAFRNVGGEIAAYGERGNEGNGVFLIPSPIDNAPMRVIASDGYGWDHVSISRTTRCPNWPEMSHVKSLFFRDDEYAFQLHPPKADHINFHPYCLHLWRPQTGELALPPKWMVGPAMASSDGRPSTTG